MRIKNQNISNIAIKNSLYSFTFTIISKMGGIVLTILLARMLLPELFGIYSLVLSILVIAVTFTDVGIDLAGVRYMSKALGQGNKKMARSFFRFLLKMKFFLAIAVVLIVLIIARPLSENFFRKPLVFLPLAFSCFYIIIESIRSFFGIQFTAKNNFKFFPPLEIIFQFSKILLSLLAISFLSYEMKLVGIFLAFASAALIFLILEIFILLKSDKELIFGNLLKIDKRKVLKYVGFIGITGITLIFFGSVDTLMLGRFVSAEYLGYYKAALVLAVSFSTLLPFGGVLLPLFTRISGKRLDRGVEKSFRYLIILAVPISIGLIFLAKDLITLIYGKEYLLATPSLLTLSILIIVSPLISLYSTIFQAKGKPKILANFVIISLIINILLNYLFIKLLLKFGPEYVLLGVALATLISNFFLLWILIKKTNKYFKIKLDKKPILKSIISSLVMAIFLFLFKKYFEINAFSGLIMILFGASIYFFVLFLIKGLNSADFLLIKELFKKRE